MKAQDAWSDFWASATDDACLPGAPPTVRNALTKHWTDFARTLSPNAEVLDIAAGNGAVLRMLRTARRDLVLTGIDYAQVGARARALGVRGGVDAVALPFADASFDGVSSQFGIDYCAVEALDEAMRVLRPRGGLSFVVHHVASPAVAHNQRRGAAIVALDQSGLFTLARAVAAGLPENAVLARAVAAARQLHAGQSVAEELPMALGAALRRAGAAGAVADLEVRARGEATRLAEMTAAARDADGIAALAARLTVAGCRARATPLLTGNGEIVAWRVDGRRS